MPDVILRRSTAGSLISDLETAFIRVMHPRHAKNAGRYLYILQDYFNIITFFVCCQTVFMSFLRTFGASFTMRNVCIETKNVLQ